jgi:propionyl-CoA carboxylase alpha chain
LIAKVVTRAPDRAGALKAQAEALDSFVIDGINNNIAFLAVVMAHERFRAGEFSTGFIAQEFPHGFAPAFPEGERAELLASVAAAADHIVRERKRAISGQMRQVQTERCAGERSVMLGNARYDVRVERGSDGIVVRFEASGKARLCVSGWTPGKPAWEGTIDGEGAVIQMRPILNGYNLAHGSAAADARVYTRREAELTALMPEKKAAGGSNLLRSPMPALVKSIEVSAGQAVKSGETLCIIEAMKMETVLRAEHDATVRTINVQPGDVVAVDAIIMEFG